MLKTKLLALVALPLLAFGANAQNFPDRPVKIIVPYPAGGTVDLVARVLAQSLSEQTGTQFVVDNRSGASGSIGSDLVAKAAPDGYTLLVQSPTLIAYPLIARKVPYDAIRDFKPVAMLGTVPMVLTINAAIPAKNLKEFVALAKAEPNKFAFGTSASGSPMHLANEAIKKESGLATPVIVYRGTAGAINDALGGQISGFIDALPSTAPHIASGKLRALAVTSGKRVAALPGVPTVAESGIAGFDMQSWYGLWAPRELPEPVARKLQDLVRKGMASRLVKDRLASQNFQADMLFGEDFSLFITRQLATYSRIVKDANISAE